MLDRLSPRAWNRLLGVSLCGLGLFGLLTLTLPVTQHLTGPVGDWLRGALRSSLGAAGAWLAPALLLLWGTNRLLLRRAVPLAVRSALLAAFAVLVATWLALAHAPALAEPAGGFASAPAGGTPLYGGALGQALAALGRRVLGPVGAYLILASVSLVFAITAFELTWPRPLEAAARFLAARFARIARVVAPASGRFVRESLEALGDAARRPAAGRAVPEDGRAAASVRERARAQAGEPGGAAGAMAPARAAEAGAPHAAAAHAVASQAAAPRAASRRSANQPSLAGHTPPVVARGATGPADLPPTALLLRTPQLDRKIDEQAIAAAGRLLEQRLRDFGVEGTVTRWHPGPVITTYEIEPAPGVRVASFVSRADDLALALRVDRVRIIAPLPGRGAVGVEVPNREPQLVRLGDVVASQEFTASGASLCLPLGLDTAGRPIATDLAKMPHLLVAGATGSGKSTCINTILVGLFLKRRPSELRLILVDPKMLELSTFAGVPHLLMPVVTDIRREAPKALVWLVQEMEDRYRLLAARGARNIDSYNASLRKDEDAQPLPCIVLVIDELADLMLVAGREVEDSIARLAQMARAVGIHLVLATQRPSVDVITGVIKANFPSRIAFQVATKVDSRTILDVNGAESLLGRGDMLYLPTGRSDPLRVHGAYVSEAECDALAAWLKENVAAPPAIDLDKALRKGFGDDGNGEVDDDLFDEAARLVLTHRLGSTSFLQRRLKVGYSRAGRLMDLLEEHGVVGRGDGSKPREVLLELDEWAAQRGAARALDD